MLDTFEKKKRGLENLKICQIWKLKNWFVSIFTPLTDFLFFNNFFIVYIFHTGCY